MLPSRFAHANHAADAAAARGDAHRAQLAAANIRTELIATQADRDSLAGRVERLSGALNSAARQLADARAEVAADRIVRDLVRSRLLVFLHDGAAFDGLLLDADDETLTFGAVHLRAEVPVPAAAGEIYIARGRVLYMQRITAEQSTPGGEG